jgi:hypothetical protein
MNIFSFKKKKYSKQKIFPPNSKINLFGLGLSINNKYNVFNIFVKSYGILEKTNSYIKILNLLEKNFFIGNLLFVRNKDINLLKEIQICSFRSSCNLKKKRRIKFKYILNKHIKDLLNWIEEINSPFFGFLTFKSVMNAEIGLIIEYNSVNSLGLFFSFPFNINLISIIKIQTSCGIFSLYNSNNNRASLFLNNQIFNKYQNFKQTRMLTKIKNFFQIFLINNNIKINFIGKLLIINNFTKRYSLFLYRSELEFFKKKFIGENLKHQKFVF